jgi:hypothetical protein
VILERRNNFTSQSKALFHSFKVKRNRATFLSGKSGGCVLSLKWVGMRSGEVATKCRVFLSLKTPMYENGQTETE